MENTIKSKSYTIHGDKGQWLGQIVITSDGMFASVTDYGNLSYAWRSYGDKDFRKFLADVGMDYFGTKMCGSMAYITYGPKIDKACK